MVNRCVAAGCSNTSNDRVSLHKFPKQRALRTKWEKQVQRTRAHWKATDHSCLCSEHFSKDCFKVDSDLAATFGLNKKRSLKPDAVPSIFHRSVEATRSVAGKRESRTWDDSACLTTKRRAVEKRE